MAPMSNSPPFPTSICFLLHGDTSGGLIALRQVRCLTVQAALAVQAAAPVSSGKRQEWYIDSANSFLG